jgi:iron(III) transport system substrate-binding protein
MFTSMSFRARSRWGVALLAAAWTGLLVCPAGSQDRAGLLEGAKREGKIVFYSSMDTRDAAALLTRFEKQYPFIKGDLFRSGREKVFARFSLEQKAGRHAADVISVGEFASLELKKQRLIAPYPSPESRVFPEEFKDPEHYWYAVYLNAGILAYNTKRVKKEEAPQTYEDLLHPRWKKRMALDANEERWVGGLVQYWGRDKTVRFLKALAQQDVYIRRGRSLLTQLLLAGEFDVQIVAYWHEVSRLQKQKAPIGWTALQPVVTGSPQVSLAAKAPHPNAGRLFVDFMLSAEGQRVLADLGRVSARPGVKPEDYPDGLKLFMPKAERLLQQVEENQRLYDSLFLKP